MILGEDLGQMPDVAGAASKGPLGGLGHAQEGMEELAVLHQLGQQNRGNGVPVLIQNAGVDFLDQPGQIDTRGADMLAGLAVDAVLDQILGLVPVVEKEGQDEADGADVNVPHLMAADHAVHGADVGAGAAAHAAEHLGEKRILGHFPAAVVQKDDVHFLLVAGGGQTLVGAADPGDVGGDGLPRGV